MEVFIWIAILVAIIVGLKLLPSSGPDDVGQSLVTLAVFGLYWICFLGRVVFLIFNK